MSINVLHPFTGWSNGYQFGLLNTKEDEVKQGANYYLGAVVQVGKFNLLNANASFFVEQMPNGIAKTAGRVACFFAPFIGLVAFPFCAAVKSGHYDAIMNQWNSLRNAAIQELPRLPELIGAQGAQVCGFLLNRVPELPRALSERSIQVCNFVTKHSGDIMRVAMIVSAVAFAVFVSPSFGIGIFVGLGLEAVDNAGLLPRKVSLFMERYLPTVSSIGNLVYGGLLLRVFSLISIATVCIPGVQMYVHHRIDDLVKDIFGVEGIRLSEYEAPLQNNKQMTYNEIMLVLNSRASFVIDPAHCSKGVISASSLASDENFDQFMPIFDSVDWASKYEIIKGKISDDDRFINFLSEQFPDIPKSQLKKDAEDSRFEECMGSLAARDGISKEVYAARWMREQQVIMVDVLTGRRRVKGSQEDLQDAIDNASKIIPYLQGLNLENDRVEIEDCFMKLAVEGGDYCARGLKRSTSEIVDGIVRKLTAAEAADATGDAGFEIKIRGSLEELRYAIVQGIYQNIMSQLQVPGAIAMDVHTMDLYRAVLSLGFSPLTEQERRNVDIFKLINWEQFENIRELMLRFYKEQMDEKFQETIGQVGAIHFANYANRLIGENENLTVDQKDELSNMIIYSWHQQEVQAKFRRLALVSMGILKKS